VVQALAPLVGAHERAELFAAIFVVSYLAFSMPAMAAGLLVAPLGLLTTVQGYAAVLLADRAGRRLDASGAHRAQGGV
jgi:hypothetical protein